MVQRFIATTGIPVTAVAVHAQSGFAAEATSTFPAPERLHVLFIAPPHGYGGDAAAECTLLERLCNIRCSAVPVPHEGGDHIADVDGHLGADDRWVPIRKAEVLRQLKRRWDDGSGRIPSTNSRETLADAERRASFGGGTCTLSGRILG